MHANIDPITFPLGGTATQMHIVAHVSPNHSASVEWLLTDDAGKRLQSGLISLDGAAYQAWGASDEYLFTWTAGKLGLTVKDVVEPPPPAAYVPPVLNEPAMD